MVAVKGKPSSITSRGEQDRKMSRIVSAAGGLKIYTDTEKIKSRCRDSVGSQFKSAALRHGSESNLNNLKSNPRSSGKSKAKWGTSVAFNIRRKVLADISNVNGGTLTTKSREGSRTSKVKRLGDLAKKKTSEGSICRSQSSPFRNTSQGNSSEAVRTRSSRQRVVNNARNVKSEQVGTSFHDHKPATSNIRFSRKNPLIPTRASLPVINHVHKVEMKENAENMERAKSKYGFAVKAKVGMRSLPNRTSSSIPTQGNRVSDVFSMMPPRRGPKCDDEALPKKVLKPVSNTGTTGFNTRKMSKSKSTYAASKLTSTAANSAREKDISSTSLSKNGASLISREQHIQEEASSDNAILGSSPLLSAAHRKACRRKSFTSSLMERPKQLKEQSVFFRPDSLPKIYDERNHLEVTEYVDDIYQYYWVMEAQNQLLKDYMKIQMEVTPQMRAILINWLIEVHLKFELVQETLYLMVMLLDQYLSLVNIKRDQMQLVGLTALLLASKYEDFWHPRIMDLISISAESYSRDEVLNMEKDFLKKLKFRLNAPTPYVFMLRFLKAAQADVKLEQLSYYLIELCLVEYEALNYKPSLLSASAIYIARCTLQKKPMWTSLLETHSRYSESQLRDCAEMILRIHKSARSAALRVTYDKYLRNDCGRVAAFEPLDKLPV